MHEKTCQILLNSTPTQLFQLLDAIALNVKTIPQPSTLTTVATVVIAHSETIQQLLLHNLRSLPGYSGLLSILSTQFRISQKSLLILLSATPAKVQFLADYLDASRPGQPNSSTAILLNLLSMVVDFNVENDCKDLIVAAFKSSKHHQHLLSQNSTVSSMMQQLQQQQSTGGSPTGTLQQILLLGYIQRHLHGTNMSSLQSRSVLQTLSEVSYETFTTEQVVEHCRTIVEQLTITYQSIGEDSIGEGDEITATTANTKEKRKLLAGFFVCCNKAYLRCRALQQNGDKRILLRPLTGWSRLVEKGGVRVNAYTDDEGEDEEEEGFGVGAIVHPRRLSIVRGRFFTDQINARLNARDITEILTELRSSVTIWDIFYRVACLCDDQNDSFRLLWRMSDHLDNPCTIVQQQLNHALPSLTCFCKMVVSSLNAIATPIASASSSLSSNNNSNNVSIRCLTKLIGLLSASSIHAWSTFIECGCIRTLNIILLRSKHFNDNGILNSLTAMYRVTDMSMELHDRLNHNGSTHARIWKTTAITLAQNLSDVMFCRALCNVMKRHSSKIVCESMELLVNNMYEVWGTVEESRTGTMRRSGSSDHDEVQMAALAKSLSIGGIVATMKFIMRKGITTTCTTGTSQDQRNGTTSNNHVEREKVDKDGTLRQVLNGKLGKERGLESADRLLDWLFWALKHAWNEELALSIMKEKHFISALWDCMLTTKYGIGQELLAKLQEFKFNGSQHIQRGSGRDQLLRQLLEQCPLLN